MDNYDKYITSSEYAININLAEVEECSGNLKKLLTQWSQKQCKFKSKFGDVESTGYVRSIVGKYDGIIGKFNFFF